MAEKAKKTTKAEEVKPIDKKEAAKAKQKLVLASSRAVEAASKISLKSRT